MEHAFRRSAIWRIGVPCLVGLIGLAALGASTDGSSGIPWSEVPITWSLFRGAPPADAVHRSEAAAIHMTIAWHASYSAGSRGGAWTGQVDRVTVSNAMDTDLSWVVPGGATEQVLRHEQGHFDLNEVYRRKLEIVLSCVRAQSATKDGVLDALYAAVHARANDVLAALQVAQHQYDAESDHGNNPAGQARWASHIDAWLRDPAAAP